MPFTSMLIFVKVEEDSVKNREGSDPPKLFLAACPRSGCSGCTAQSAEFTIERELPPREAFEVLVSQLRDIIATSIPPGGKQPPGRNIKAGLADRPEGGDRPGA